MSSQVKSHQAKPSQAMSCHVKDNSTQNQIQIQASQIKVKVKVKFSSSQISQLNSTHSQIKSSQVECIVIPFITDRLGN